MGNNEIIDQRIIAYGSLITPYHLLQNVPMSEKAMETVLIGRKNIENILKGEDPRKIIITGPCSIHDPEAAKEYSNRARDLSEKVSDQFLIIMRMYFEKPRTTIGWKGLIYDPNLDGSNDMNKGLHLSREILLHNAEIGLPSATEYLEAITPQYNSDLISWAAIGARTVESPQHRQLASGLSMPVGFKNSTQGDIGVAVDAIISARKGHSFLSINEYGIPSIVSTSGNPYSHLVLRGGNGEPNYTEKEVKKAQELLEKAKLPPKVVIDCSHGNSSKDYKKQPEVFEDVNRQIVDGNNSIVGIMFESNIKAGNQKIPSNLKGFDRTTLEYGLSATDGCIDWKTTELLVMDAYKTLSRTIVPVTK
ncbi:MAG: 3-deoxy-7-phosphoheptulonate synthase [archaeon]